MNYIKDLLPKLKKKWVVIASVTNKKHKVLIICLLVGLKMGSNYLGVFLPAPPKFLLYLQTFFKFL